MNRRIRGINESKMKIEEERKQGSEENAKRKREMKLGEKEED